MRLTGLNSFCFIAREVPQPAAVSQKTIGKRTGINRRKAAAGFPETLFKAYNCPVRFICQKCCITPADVI
jgi:hypothetical protein